MKNILIFAAIAAAVRLLAAPQSIQLESGDLKIRLDSAKAWTISGIVFQGYPVGVDTVTNYGTVVNIAGTNGFVGSGHKETGFKEEVESLKLFVDGVEADLTKTDSFKGKNIRIEKLSRLRDFTLKSEIVIAGNRIHESAEITSATEVKLANMYHFMHSWTPEFKELFVAEPGGEEKTYIFKGDDKWPVYRPVPAAAWFNPDVGIGVATLVLPGSGQHAPLRFVWDRTVYRKDYVVDFTNAVFPAGRKASYAVATGFFRKPQGGTWIEAAKNTWKALKANQ